MLKDGWPCGQNCKKERREEGGVKLQQFLTKIGQIPLPPPMITPQKYRKERNVLMYNIYGGGYRGGVGDILPPPEFGIFCLYFQNSFSIACFRERNPSAKQEKYLSE